MDRFAIVSHAMPAFIASAACIRFAAAKRTEQRDRTCNGIRE